MLSWRSLITSLTLNIPVMGPFEDQLSWLSHTTINSNLKISWSDKCEVLTWCWKHVPGCEMLLNSLGQNKFLKFESFLCAFSTTILYNYTRLYGGWQFGSVFVHRSVFILKKRIIHDKNRHYLSLKQIHAKIVHIWQNWSARKQKVLMFILPTQKVTRLIKQYSRSLSVAIT